LPPEVGTNFLVLGRAVKGFTAGFAAFTTFIDVPLLAVMPNRLLVMGGMPCMETFINSSAKYR